MKTRQLKIPNQVAFRLFRIFSISKLTEMGSIFSIVKELF